MRGLTTSIDATTNIPSVVERAKASFVGFEKQVGDIGKKFSTGFKDIFLGFFAPMALFQTAMGYITDSIAKAKQDAKEGLDLLAKGESQFATNEQARTAAFFKRRKELQEEQDMIAKGKEELAKTLLTSPEGKGIVLPEQYMKQLQMGGTTISRLAENKTVQDIIFDQFKRTPEGAKIIAETMPTGSKAAEAFKTPEGFSNVVGVGPSPVMEAMAAQLEEAQKQTALLEKIAGGDAATGWMNKDSK